MDKKLFIGMEETNIDEFISKCCKTALSLEPLCKVCCGECGKICEEKDIIHIGKEYKLVEGEMGNENS